MTDDKIIRTMYQNDDGNEVDIAGISLGNKNQQYQEFVIDGKTVKIPNMEYLAAVEAKLSNAIKMIENTNKTIKKKSILTKSEIDTLKQKINKLEQKIK